MNQAVNIPLNKQEILKCLQKAIQKNFIDNLRHRHPNVALDSRLRGYVGELAFRKWMLTHGISFSNSNLRDESSGMDIDFVYTTSSKQLELELKTSLLPDADATIPCTMKRRDIKLIKRGNQKIEGLKSDIHVQIIFKQLRIRKDEWLKKRKVISMSSSTSEIDITLENIYQELAAFRYETDTYLVGWIDKTTLVKQIQNKPITQQTWKYGMRVFWTCNIAKEAKKPMKLVDYLNTISE